ncbi:MAG: hypothetical protein K2L17_06660 [Muribaculaceae bacterium]|nr:hypothetical protein [Muribaculaceae bacterium]
MRNILLTITASLFACIFAGDLKAQDKTYLPILEIGKKWTCCSYNVDEGPNKPLLSWSWEAVDMAEEDGRQFYSLLYSGVDEYYGPVTFLEPKFEYEENGVLWTYEDGECDYMPMVDFNMEVGDKVLEWYDIIWKDNVDIEGVSRCVIAIKSLGSAKINYWIEGIGAIDSVYASPTLKTTGGDERSCMAECRMGDTVLFDINHLDDYLSLADVKTFTSLNEENAPIYDLYGRRISTPAPGQIYIQGGKKYIGDK